MIAQVIRIADIRAAREAHHRAVFMPSVKAPYPVQLMWRSGMYFFAGMGFSMIFAGWLTSEIARSCFTAAGYCDDRGQR